MRKVAANPTGKRTRKRKRKRKSTLAKTQAKTHNKRRSNKRFKSYKPMSRLKVYERELAMKKAMNPRLFPDGDIPLDCEGSAFYYELCETEPEQEVKRYLNAVKQVQKFTPDDAFDWLLEDFC